MHDREIRLDNGWSSRLPRPDFYQKPGSWFEVGANDLSMRKVPSRQRSTSSVPDDQTWLSAESAFRLRRATSPGRILTAAIHPHRRSSLIALSDQSCAFFG